MLEIVYNATDLQGDPKSFEGTNGRARARQKESVASKERALAEHSYQLQARKDTFAVLRIAILDRLAAAEEG